MKTVVFFCSLLLAAFLFPNGTDDVFCGVRNSAFQAGETVTFKIYYLIAGVYFGAGEAVFSVNEEKYNDKEVYHITGTGSTNSFIDQSFKVRDKYETYMDTGTLQSYKFVRNVYEGGYKIYENVAFSRAAGTAITSAGVYKVPSCVQDVLSAVFCARNIDFGKYKPDEKIPFSMFLDNRVYNLYIRYLGKEIIKTRYGRFRAIKFRPLLIRGTIFTGGEKMTVWISDDANHLPLRVESPIVIGNISVDMMSFRKLRHPLKSLISQR